MKGGKMAVKDMVGSEEKKECSPEGLKQAKNLVGQLESLAAEEGLELEDLIEMASGGMGEMEEEEEGGDAMVKKFSSQLKAKRNAMSSQDEEYA